MDSPENMTLPPFAALKAFHVAARVDKLKDAAQRLGVTEAAMSSQIKNLEQFFGRRLFDRHPGGIVLTDDGRQFFRLLEPAFTHLVAAVRDMQGPGAGARVTLTLPPSLAMLWLIPRLSDLEGQHPDLHVNLITTTRLVDLERERVDLSIRYGTGGWRGLAADLLIEETVTPVASAQYAANLSSASQSAAPPGVASPVGKPLAALLAGAKLITTPYYGDEWGEWASARGLPLPESSTMLNFESYEQSLQAALQGLGVLLGRRPLIDAALKKGELVPIAAEWADRQRAGFYLCRPEGVQLTAPANRLMRWLRQQAADLPTASA